jgi:hypothetical protein
MYEMPSLRQRQEGSLVKRVDSLLSPLVKDLGIESNIKFIEIKKIWHTLFSEPLSCHMVPYKMIEGAILLNVDSPVWLQELNYFKKDIIKKLGPYGIKDVRFNLGKVPKKARSEDCNRVHREKALTPEEVSYIEKAVSQIIEEDLRVTVKRAIEKAISSRIAKKSGLTSL